MLIRREKGLILSDTAVPDLFISDYMAALDALSIKCYLLLLLLLGHQKAEVSEAELSRYLGAGGQEISEALTLLLRQDLIRMDDEGITLCDIKQFAMEKHQAAERHLKSASDLSPECFNRREAVVSQINETFFQGVMPLYFYHEIDQWFQKYQFEAEVVYAIFREAAERNKLNGSAYVRSIALNWSTHGVRSFSDLSRYFENYAALRQLAEKVRRKMNMKQALTEYQMEMVERWSDDWKFSFDIIDEALRRTSRIAQPNLNYADRILQEWHEAGLSELAEIKAYEQKRRRSAKQTGKGDAARDSRVGNFEQRRYEPSDYEKLYATEQLALSSEEIEATDADADAAQA